MIHTTSLENSYCVPRTEEEWEMIYPNANWLGLYPSKESHVYFDGAGKYLASGPNENPNRSEIPVHKFFDLFNDRIAGWRMKEVGFLTPFNAPIYRLLTPNHIVHVEAISESGESFIHNYIVRVDGGETYITTFTDLLTLIRMLTPPIND